MSNYIHFYFSGELVTVKEIPYNLRNLNKMCQVRIRASDIVAVYENLQRKKKFKYNEEATDNIKKEFRCEKCGRSYEQEKFLYRHAKYTCDAEVKFTCDSCDYETKYKGNLVKHIHRLHSKNMQCVQNKNGQRMESKRKYKCSVCSRTYTDQDSLLCHERHFCGAEPKFVCHDCGHKSKQKSNLYRHIVKKHLIAEL